MIVRATISASAMSLAAIWTQFFPPPGPLTEANLSRQDGRVFIVTGGSSGLGYELSRILYGAGGKVCILTRSKEHAEDAIARIQAHYPQNENGSAEGKGSLQFIHMDMLDFTTVKSAAQQFLDREARLDILFNNAGVGAGKNAPPSRQGHEYHFCVNSLGPYLLTRLLEPILSVTAKLAPQNSVRVVWPASILVEMGSPKTGIRPEFLQDTASVKDANELYITSKTASWFLASEFARRQTPGSKVVHITGNPGNYVTNVWRNTPSLLYYFLRPILRSPVHGAETYLWMAFSNAVTVEDALAGRYAMCNGRWHPGQRDNLILALRSVTEGGSGRASEFFEWCGDKADAFLE
ncbi:hypothetical protein F5X99DRAFT_401341 [Biscogniauxia marginata]|nr:hypothetical protein F5X99DRAFT_401341 [Biscogniauxia marginata]